MGQCETQKSLKSVRIWLWTAGIAVLMGEMLCDGAEKEVEKSRLAWVEGAELNERGDIFQQGDDVLFTGESYVAVMDEIECGRLRIAEGARVTLIPYAGDLVLKELKLEGTLVFTAPWRGYHWTIVTGEQGMLVLDFGMFDLDLEASLPGPYGGVLELRSGRVHYRGSRATGVSNFSLLRVAEEGQFYLRAGSLYEGDVHASGSGWIREQDKGGSGALRFEGQGETTAVLRGNLTLEDDLSVQVYGEGEEGKIEGNLDAAGYALEKRGAGTLWVVGGRWKGLNKLVVREGRLVLEGNVDEGATYQESGVLCVSGGGILELWGGACSLSELWMEEGGHLDVQGGKFQSDVLCGNGKLTAPDGQITIGELRDYSGEISARLVRLCRVSQGEGHDATVCGHVVANSFVKGGEGAIRMGYLQVSGELWMRYSGTLELGELVLEDGTLLRYGEGDAFVQVQDALISGRHLADPTVRLLVNSHDFNEWQLQRGVELGIGEDLERNLVVSGLTDYRLEVHDGGIWLYANPILRTADWDPNWGERTLLRQPGNKLPEILLTDGEVLAMRETSLPCCSEDGASTCARFRGTATEEGVEVYGGCVLRNEMDSDKAYDSWIDAAEGYFTRLVGGNSCHGIYRGQTHLLLRGGSVCRAAGGNDSSQGNARFEGESYLSIYDGVTLRDMFCGGSVCSGGDSLFVGKTHCFIYALLGGDTIVSGGNFYENRGNGKFGGTTLVVLELKGQRGEFAAEVVGGDYAAAVDTAANLKGRTQIMVHADECVNFSGMLIGGSYSEKGQEIAVSGRTMMQIEGGIFEGKVVGGSAALGGVSIGGAADAILLLYGGIYREFVIGGCYAEGQRGAEVELGDVLVMVEEGVVLQDLVGGSMAQSNAKVQQGNITLLLHGGKIEGDVYASGAGDASFSTRQVAVSVGNRVRFERDGAILSGGVRHNVGDSEQKERQEESVGERRLQLEESVEYKNLRGVEVRDFDILELTPGASAEFGGLIGENVLICGGGELTLQAGNGSVQVDELTVGKGTRLSIGVPEEGKTRLNALLSVQEGGTLQVKLAHNEQIRNTRLDTNGIILQRGGILELSVYLTREMMQGKDNKGLLRDGVLEAEKGSVLSLRFSGTEDRLPLTGGGVTKLVLAEHAEGVPELDLFTRERLAKYFGTTARIGVVNGQLLLTGESVSEQTAHFHRDVASTPNGRAGAGLLDSLLAVVDPQNSAPGSDRAKLLQAQERLIGAGRMVESDRLSAAAAGASLAALQPAFMAELRRALQSVAQMALREEDLPECDGTSFWIVQGTGGTQRLTENNNDSGYSATSWGGILAVQRGLANGAQLGVHLSATSWRWHAHAADAARADCESYGLSAYYRIRRGKFLHAFVGQGAITHARMERDLSFVGEEYKTTGRTTGGGFSALYALIYEPTQPETSVRFRPLMQVAWSYGFLDGYRERGSDAALVVGQQSQQIVSAGVGASLVGESSQILSRHWEWGVRLLLSAEGGSLGGEVCTAMQRGGHYHANLRSHRPGCIVTELDASITVPMSECTAVVAQAAAELRGHSGGATVSLGYQLNF